MSATIAFLTPMLFMSLEYSSYSSFMKYLAVISPVHAENTPKARELFAESMLTWMKRL